MIYDLRFAIFAFCDSFSNKQQNTSKNSLCTNHATTEY